jgi:nitrate reductase gamma subunit
MDAAMESWLDLARGPLFAIAFLVMVLGLGRHLVLQMHALLLRKGRRLKQVSWRRIALDSLGWAVPWRHFIRGTIFISAISFLFHVGVILVPLFCRDHVLLWEEFLGIGLPALGRGAADALTLGTIGCTLLLLGYRTFIRRARDLSRPSDYVLLVMVLLPFASGYMASHPGVSPLPWGGMMLIHLLSAEILMIAVPFTKLSHIVLVLFDRLSELHWQLRPGAGEKVAEALFGKEARV